MNRPEPQVRAPQGPATGPVQVAPLDPARPAEAARREQVPGTRMPRTLIRLP